MKIKLLFFVLFVFSFIACDEIPDEVVNSPNSEYNVSGITAPDYVVFTQTDSSIVATMKIDNPDVISQVWYNVITSNASETIISNVSMFDDGNRANYGDDQAGDSVYSGKTYLGKTKSSGKYLLQFYVKDNVNNDDDNIRIVGFHELEFDNGQNKVAPVISDLVMPDTIKRGVDFVFTLRVTDGNSLKDISQVYFKFTRPNNTTSGTILMVDDGATLGDETAGDGIYSFKNSFSDGTPLPNGDPNPIAQTGEYIFLFRAEDKSGLISNEISHTILVKE